MKRSLKPSDYEWAKIPFLNAMRYLRDEDTLMHLSVRGITTIYGMRQHLSELIDARDETSDDVITVRKLLRISPSHKEFLEKEIKSDYSRVIAHATVAVWIALETLISDVTINFILKDRALMREKPFSRVRFSLMEIEEWTDHQRAWFVYKEVERDLRAAFRPGIARFETLLEPLGLSGVIGAKTRRDLLELNYVRNLFVHRAGYVDEQFKRNCPWRRVKVGARLQVRLSDYKKYHIAADKYVVALINRVRRLCGLKRLKIKPT